MKTTLEQWRMFKAVVEHGGYAQAADAIHKSQSTISYGVHKLQEQLGVQLLEVEGRKAVLTDHGKILLQRADQLLDQAENLDKVADSLSSGVEPMVHLALDMVYPYEQLFGVLQRFSDQYPNTRVELEEFVLSGGNEMLAEGTIDLLVTPRVPAGYNGEHIFRAKFVPVSSADHPLQHLGRGVTYDDLTQHRQVVLRDSSKKAREDSGWLGAHQRWTVTHFSTSLNIIRRGLAYAWVPEHIVHKEIINGTLTQLPMAVEAARYADLYLVKAHGDMSGPATNTLAELLAHFSAVETEELENKLQQALENGLQQASPNDEH